MNLTAIHGKNTYECHTGDIRVHTSDIRMTCEWHTDDIRLHTSDIQMTYEWYTSTYDWHVNDWRNIKLHNGFGAFRLLFLTICVKNTALYSFKRFLSLGCSFLILFAWTFPSSTTGSANLNNLKGGPYYILRPGLALILPYLICGVKLFRILSLVKIYVFSTSSFNQIDQA